VIAVRPAPGLFASVVALALCGGCRGDGDAPRTTAVRDVPAATFDAGPQQPPGMIWIPAGTLKAGTPPDKTPRIAAEELPGVDESLTGFYIDTLPYPNEAGAIPTTNVSREEAAQLCEKTGKRLCSELEWERACKGPDNATYEYGDEYSKDKCGTGVSVEEGARRPSGDRVLCKSGFGVREMHGGPWEWTSSPWGRGHHGDLGVLRGGNAVAGELAGRCANALGRAPTQKSPVMGFRCCKGDPNPNKVELTVTTGRALEPQLKPDAARIGRAARNLPGVTLPDTGTFFITSSWTWRPTPNEVLTLASGCAKYEKGGRPVGCALFAFRPGNADAGASDFVLTGVPADVGIGEMVLAGDARHVRVRGLMSQGGLYVRDVTYSYGRVGIGEQRK